MNGNGLAGARRRWELYGAVVAVVKMKTAMDEIRVDQRVIRRLLEAQERRSKQGGP